ncbi:peptidoglycan-binding protein [Patescibacteria group bacterium]|nr:peptidoglycan-binding protein [Patescibacteria group bacterium]
MKNKYLLILILSLIFPVNILASASEGEIDDEYKYAWSENIGWINFDTTNGNIIIKDDEITGYAWSENLGWINLNPNTSGVQNDNEGNLSGYAWGENTGWINFSEVTIDNDGYFNGYATGDITGRISFNCENTDSCDSSNFKVRTDWRHLSLRVKPINPPKPSFKCSDGIDNDGDGLIDYPNDPGCSSLNDNSEASDNNVNKENNSNNGDDDNKNGNNNNDKVNDENNNNNVNNGNDNSGNANNNAVENNNSQNQYKFTKPLDIGEISEDVKNLQIFLNNNGFLISEDGPGSKGNETNYFGPKTKEALIKFQNEYKKEILEPLGIDNGTGYLGRSTINFIEKLSSSSNTNNSSNNTSSNSNQSSNTGSSKPQELKNQAIKILFQ